MSFVHKSTRDLRSFGTGVLVPTPLRWWAACERNPCCNPRRRDGKRAAPKVSPPRPACTYTFLSLEIFSRSLPTFLPPLRHFALITYPFESDSCVIKSNTEYSSTKESWEAALTTEYRRIRYMPGEFRPASLAANAAEIWPRSSQPLGPRFKRRRGIEKGLRVLRSTSDFGPPYAPTLRKP